MKWKYSHDCKKLNQKSTCWLRPGYSQFSYFFCFLSYFLFAIIYLSFFSPREKNFVLQKFCITKIFVIILIFIFFFLAIYFPDNCACEVQIASWQCFLLKAFSIICEYFSYSTMICCQTEPLLQVRMYFISTFFFFLVWFKISKLFFVSRLMRRLDCQPWSVFWDIL